MQKTFTLKTGLLTFLLLALLSKMSIAQGNGEPGTQHGNDLYLGLNANGGTAPSPGGAAAAVWFSDTSSNPTRLATWFATPQNMTPNINGPTGSGQLYFNLGTNVVTAYPNGQPTDMMSSSVMQLVSISPGLKMYASDTLLFDADPAFTLNLNKVALPYAGGGWHKHFNIRAFKTGTYTLAFKYTNNISPAASPVGDSPVYTLTLRNRPVAQGCLLIPGSTRTDTTPYGTGNVVRVFLFPANSAPTSAASALTYTDVYVNPNGTFGVPELLKSGANFLRNGDSFRIGFQSLAVKQAVTAMFPGNIVISPTSPAQLGDISLPLGDVNGDNKIDVDDLTLLLNVYNTRAGDGHYTAEADLSGNGTVDVDDLTALLTNYNVTGAFTPLANRPARK